MAKDLTNYEPKRIVGVSIPDAIKLWRFDLYSEGELSIRNGWCFAYPRGEGLLEPTLGIISDDSSWQLIIPYKVTSATGDETQGPIAQGDRLVLKSEEGTEIELIVSSTPIIFPGGDFITVFAERGRL